MTGTTRRSAGARRRGRTAARSRRSAGTARRAAAGRGRRSGTSRWRRGRGRRARGRGRTVRPDRGATGRGARGRRRGGAASPVADRSPPAGRRATAVPRARWRAARRSPCQEPRRSIRFPFARNSISPFESRASPPAMTAATLARQDLGPPRRPRRIDGGRTRPVVHRPASRPRGDQPAGIRGPAPVRPARSPARTDRRHRGPQRPDHGHRPPDRRRGLGQAGRRAAPATPPSSASPTTRWATPARESSTSSGRSRAAPCRA